VADFTIPERGTELWCSRCQSPVGQVTCPDPSGIGCHKLLCGSRITVDAIVTMPGDRHLLVRRKGGRAEGMLALPGGFVDLDERCLPAVKREVEEEAGLEIPLEAWELSGIYEYGQNNMALVYAALWAGYDPPQPAADHPEVAEVVCLRAEELDERRAELAYDHYEMLANHLAGKRVGLRWSSS
jgi:ADP-ribose pyrophosphatase YjhB (NUDIX family)